MINPHKAYRPKSLLGKLSNNHSFIVDENKQKVIGRTKESFDRYPGYGAHGVTAGMHGAWIARQVGQVQNNTGGINVFLNYQ